MKQTTLNKDRDKRPALESEEYSFQTLFFLSPTGMAISDMATGRFVEINEQYCAITGYKREQLLGKTSLELGLISGPSRKEIVDAVSKNGFVRALDIDLISASKATKVVTSSIHHATFNGRECLITTVMDMTERKRLEKELRHQAQTDGLSGLANRRYFMYLAEKEVARSIRHQRDLSLLMLDIDHFKHINDAYSHHAGDNVIRAFASMCKSMLRQEDISGRIGGEEFAVILPESGPAAGLRAAERIRHGAANTPIAIDDKKCIEFTVSVGLTSLKVRTGVTLDALLREADESLYEAKRSGRNRVCLYPA